MRDSTPEPRPDREVRPLSGHPDYRRLRRDFPPGGETTREQGFGAPADQYPPAEQADEEYVENPAAAAGGESAPDEPDLPPPEGALPDHERGAVTLADAARDLAHDEPTYPAPLPRTPPTFRPPVEALTAPPEALDTMTEERADLRDPAEELERSEEPDPEDTVPGVPDAGAAARDAVESGIDEALIGTFPASDPIALPNPRR